VTDHFICWTSVTGIPDTLALVLLIIAPSTKLQATLDNGSGIV